jgi:hypothetical protein
LFKDTVTGLCQQPAVTSVLQGFAANRLHVLVVDWVIHDRLHVLVVDWVIRDRLIVLLLF